MIIIYYSISNNSSKNALKWFKNKKIDVLQKRVEQISRKDLLHALTLSDNGISELLKQSIKASEHSQTLIQKILSLSFEESVELILKHPEVLKLPLIIGEKKINVGYNTENIRTFIPKKHRSLELKFRKDDSEREKILMKISDKRSEVAKVYEL